ncbi:choice-of-anchor Q domain-containing protein [Microcella sp.]|uniref:choice-of-anchor Q domain-containing protein n=1 Tax=Microcella sp. TaxID=1913979 RepID=UPI0025602055|nr:choice-of-anchor Q domain-containing protein [Microcella sp.]MBX9472946.1 right-handed parallel beta-helix repeat-containing protein [Microcella sp.]
MSLVFGGTGAVVVAAPAYAATFTVDSLTDDGAGVTLREAIVSANGSAGVDTIAFAPGLSGGTLVIDSVLLITEGLVIDGLGSANLSIERSGGNPTSDFFAFQPTAADQDLTISGLTISGDLVKTGSGVVINDNVATPRSVTLDDVTIEDMVTSAIGGPAVIVDGMTGVLNITDSEFADNSGAGPGGAISATNVGTAIFVTDSLFTANASTTDGGAIYINSPTAFVNISGSEFLSNVAGFGGAGGAVFVLFATHLTVGDVTFQENTSYNAGGGLVVFSVTSLTVTDTLFSRNTVTANEGGGLYVAQSLQPVSLDSVQFTFNAALDAGGLLIDGGNEVLITDSTFRENTSSGVGGAIRQFGTDGSLTIERTTFDGNETDDDGGAIYVDEVESDGSVTIDSSAFFGNFAGDVGASLAIPSIAGEVTVINSTLDERELVDFAVYAATESGGQLRVHYSTVYGMIFIDSNAGTSEVVSSILDGGFDPALVVDAGDPADVWYSIMTSPLVPANVNDLGGNQFSVADTKLGPLQNNGGPTLTRLPLAGSPAIDSGLPGGTPPTFDQRFTGFPRVIGGRIDVGAVEATPELAATGAEFSVVIPLVGGVLLLLLGTAAVVARPARRRTH